MTVITMTPMYQYYQQVKNIFNTSLIGYWPLDEASGADILDASGNSRNGTYTSVTLGQPGIGDGKTSALFDGSTSYGSVFSTSLRDAFNGSEGTFVIWDWADEAIGTDIAIHEMFRVQVDTSNRIYIQKEATNTDSVLFAYKAGGVNCFGSISQIATKWAGYSIYVLTWSKSANRVRCYVNREQQGADITPMGDWSGSLALAILGAGSTVPATPWKGWEAHWALGNRELTAAEVASLSDGIPRGYLVFEGDSRTSGTGATTATAYPPSCARKLTANWKCTNMGGSGATIQNMIDEIATTLAVPAGTWSTKVAILWGSVNAATDAATMHGKIITWCNTARAAGYTVIICTEVDAQDAARLSADWPNQYLALNTLIRDNYTTYADALADLGGNANLQDATNITYFDADKVHLTAAGYLVVAGIVGTVINGL